MISSPNTGASTEAFNKIHDYFIGKVIGRGGLYSQIRSAYHRKHKAPLAVKIISKNKIMGLPKKHRILFNETILAPLFDHPNIIRVEEIIETETRIFSFMQYADNGDLLTYLRSKPVDIALATKFVDQLVNAVEKIHSLGIVHRDIKPENILVMDNNTLKLCDFGLASITNDGLMNDNCGSFEYSSPESIRQKQFDGLKADMWSVGVIMYTLFSKKLPFMDVTHDYDYNRDLDFSRIPEQYKDICRRLLSTDPDARPHAFEIRKTTGYSFVDPIFIGISGCKIDTVLSSKLCQAIGIPFQEILADIESEEFSELKVLAALLSTQNMFRSTKKAVSVPQQRLPLMFQKKFKTDGCDVIAEMKAYLLPKKCSLSSPFSSSPEIVINGKHDDKRVSFQCQDEIDGYCSLELFPEEGSDDVCRSVMRHLEHSFNQIGV